MLKNSEIMSEEHILGIDFGTSKIGLALADTETRLAFAYAMLKNDRDLWDELNEVITKENIQKIVIGKPGYVLRDNNGISEAEVFGEEVTEKFGIKVFFVEEMFTTKSAQQNLREAQKKNVGKIDDAESAKIILQDWLDKN
jgi:putative Holliday junction resolvase